MALLTELAEAHGNKLPLDLRGRSWTAATFMAYFKQHISMAIHPVACCGPHSHRCPFMARPLCTRA